MENENTVQDSLETKEKADLLKGGMSYKEHYDYLMDWYLKDRKLSVPHADVHESLKDVLEALKELNAKIESGSAEAQRPRSRGIFARLYA
jgi:hypothetical protein